MVRGERGIRWEEGDREDGGGRDEWEAAGWVERWISGLMG